VVANEEPGEEVGRHFPGLKRHAGLSATRLEGESIPGAFALAKSNTPFFNAVTAVCTILLGASIMVTGVDKPPYYSGVIEYGRGATPAGLILIAIDLIVGYRAGMGYRGR
jgi:hypothetical protein